MARSSERGIAVIVVMFMVLITSVIGATMMAGARTETLSTANYRAAAQSRYAAESGVASAVNWILNNYTPPFVGSGTDPIGAFDISVSPVTWNGNPAVLSSDPDVGSNYPVGGIGAAFNNEVPGELDVGVGTASYVASARLMAMFVFPNAVTGGSETVQTWDITGVGTAGGGANVAEVSVEATLDTPLVPIFAYAMFGDANGCDILSIGGGASVDSYDSGALVGGMPVLDPTGGNVGTNGNLAMEGTGTTINGTLSTPKAGVGTCTDTNVTAVTISGKGTVSEGLIELPQTVDYEDPEPISPTPPTTAQGFAQNSGCPASVSYCTPNPGTGATIVPPTADTVMSLGNVSVSGGAELHLSAGIYQVNSITLAGNAKLVVDSGPVIFRVEGAGVPTPINFSGGSISNTSYVASDLQFIYGGTGDVTMAGGAESSALVYAPNADITLTGNADLYGAVIGDTVTMPGGTRLHYDRALGTTLFKPGNISLTTFNWDSF